MSWGRGWEVGVRKSIWEHERTLRIAAELLHAECGVRHETGTRKDLCPNCQRAPRVATGGVSSPTSGEGGAP